MITASQATSSERGAPRLAVVMPCYNEQEALPATAARMSEYLDDLITRDVVGEDSALYFVDDGSRDGTWAAIADLTRTRPRVRGIKLTRNFGHQGAVLAGMFEAAEAADVVVTIDADLQDDETCIEKMVAAYRSGAEIVYGVREDRTADTVFKRATAEGYYRILGWLGVNVVFNHADYRLMSRRAIGILGQYRETNLFLRGIVPLIGLNSQIVSYTRRERQAGVSKYPLKKMLALAWQGVTSFSVMPLRLVAALGAIMAVASSAVGIWALGVRLIGTGAVPGWASTVIPMYFLGGIQLFFLGVLGEYLGKIYMEVKDRPRYLIDRRTWQDERVPEARDASPVRPETRS